MRSVARSPLLTHATSSSASWCLLNRVRACRFLAPVIFGGRDVSVSGSAFSLFLDSVIVLGASGTASNSSLEYTSSFNCTNTAFVDGKTDMYGAAIRVNSESELTGNVVDCQFKSNTATLGGGVFFASPGVISFDNCLFASNSASAGAHILIAATELYVTSSQFSLGLSSRSNAECKGCALANFASCDFFCNEGKIYLLDSTPVFKDCCFMNYTNEENFPIQDDLFESASDIKFEGENYVNLKSVQGPTTLSVTELAAKLKTASSSTDGEGECRIVPTPSTTLKAEFSSTAVAIVCSLVGLLIVSIVGILIVVFRANSRRDAKDEMRKDLN